MPVSIGRRWPALPVAAAILALHALAPHPPHARPAAASYAQSPAPSAPLFDGRTLTGWAIVGSGEWTVEDALLVGQGARGAAVLKSARTFRNVTLRAEIRAEDGAETSLGIRCPERDAAPATARSCYRVSLDDRHAVYPTGSLVDHARTRTAMTTAGEWTRVEIVADGPRIVVRVNGAITADIRDERLASGTITVETPQRGRVRVRRMEVAPVATEGAR